MSSVRLKTASLCHMLVVKTLPIEYVLERNQIQNYQKFCNKNLTKYILIGKIVLNVYTNNAFI